ncbi:putative baseplate component [Acinetobacter phage vB_AbaM_Acibel004]|uniref:putative baseplate component n=1 Tax=Acinetobacter phage vB_AbaM_Acibel004 TaxID=1481186 RepID=UPI0004E85FB3|nr:putative baseplate component [Acinetobacter phage vB_AbaM_Acibel004]AHY26757.1 putative baseplate component [Acinetobacter phage vB_AbaM_Acibel004]
MAILNDSGIEIQKLEGILQELQSIAKKKFADLVDPKDELDVSDSSLLGRILGIVAEPEASNEELLFMLWQSLDPDQAEGIYLDKILNLVGVKRKSETRGYSGLMLHGKMGATVPEKSMVSSNLTGDVFETTTGVTFSNTDTNGVVVKIETIVPNTVYKLGYTSTYGTNTYPTITTRSVEGDTKEMVARRFMETVNSSSTLLEATVDNDDNIKVVFKNQNYIGNFTAQTDGIKLIESFMPVSSISITADAVRQASNTLDVMQTSVVGWIGVTNPFDSIASEPKEDDVAFRTRGRFSRGMKSVSNRVSMYSDLYDLDGVRFVNIKENIYDNPAGGRSSKGISVVVLGGNDQDIAQTIFNNLPLGCATDGVLEEPVYDEAGVTKVKFSRPEVVDVVISISLSADSTFPQNGKVLIQEAIVRHIDSLDVGDSIVWSKLFSPINEVKGQSVNSLLIGKKGEPLTSGNIDLNFNQIPSISFENIDI